MAQFTTLGERNSYWIVTHYERTTKRAVSEDNILAMSSSFSSRRNVCLYLNGEENVPFLTHYSGVVVKVVGPGSISYQAEFSGEFFFLTLSKGARISEVIPRNDLGGVMTFIGTHEEIQQSLDSVHQAVSKTEIDEECSCWNNHIAFSASDCSMITLVHHESEREGQDVIRLPPFNTQEITTIKVAPGTIPADSYVHFLEKEVSEFMLSSINF